LSKPLSEVEALIGHTFADPALLQEALTHPSALTRGRNDRAPDYERLEFLGDRVLSLLIASRLFLDHPKADTGALASRFNQMVQRETLADIVRDIGLAPHIRMSRSERDSGGADKPALLADVCEAVIAALYLDGGMEAARQFVMPLWVPRLDGQVKVPSDPKMALQEWAHAQGGEPPVYTITDRAGPDHAPVFTIRALLAQGEATATGRSKKEAERAAAALLLKQVGGDD